MTYNAEEFTYRALLKTAYLTKTAISYNALKGLAKLARPLKKPVRRVKGFGDGIPGGPFALNPSKSVMKDSMGIMNQQMNYGIKNNLMSAEDAIKGKADVDKAMNIAKTLGKTINKDKGSADVFLKKMRPDLPNLNNKDKEVVNRVIDHHEFDETNVKTYAPIAGHLNPNVILKERNLVNSLPKEYQGVKDYMAALRKGAPIESGGTGLSEYDQLALTTGVDIDRLKGQRLSRHAIKYISNKHKKVMTDQINSTFG